MATFWPTPAADIGATASAASSAASSTAASAAATGTSNTLDTVEQALEPAICSNPGPTTLEIERGKLREWPTERQRSEAAAASSARRQHQELVAGPKRCERAGEPLATQQQALFIAAASRRKGKGLAASGALSLLGGSATTAGKLAASESFAIAADSLARRTPVEQGSRLLQRLQGL